MYIIVAMQPAKFIRKKGCIHVRTTVKRFWLRIYIQKLFQGFVKILKYHQNLYCDHIGH